VVELSGLFFVSVEGTISPSAASETVEKGLETGIEPNTDSEPTDDLSVACERHRSATRSDNHSLNFFGFFQTLIFEISEIDLSALPEDHRHGQPSMLFDRSVEIDEGTMQEIS